MEHITLGDVLLFSGIAIEMIGVLGILVMVFAAIASGFKD